MGETNNRAFPHGDGISHKKRKHLEETSGVDTEPSKLSKEERREAKRLRRLEKEAKVEQASSAKPEILKIDPEEERKAAKAARKAEKARRKAEIEVQAQAVDTPKSQTSNRLLNGPKIALEKKSSSDKAASREAQKQDKARRKAEQKAEVVETAHDGPQLTNGVPEGSIVAPDESKKSEEATKTEARKQEKARRKAEKKAKAQAKDAPAINGSRKAEHEASGLATRGETSSKPLGYEEDPALSALPQISVDSFLNSNHVTILDTSTDSRPKLRPIIDFKHLPQDSELTSNPSPFASFKQPTPIQAAAWPHLLAGRDVVGIAETGSGKTLAFGVPCIRAITAMEPSPRQSPARAVIVSPTRELASQIHVQLDALAKSASLHTVCVYGGVPKEDQRAALRKAHIIVATPGRLNDLISEGSTNLSAVQYLVLDEADRMLDKGFEDAIRDIISSTPPTGRQTSMFTATWPQSVRQLASTFLTNPIRITIGDSTQDNPTGELRANKMIKQVIEVTDPTFKEGRLRELVKQYSPNAKSGALQKNNRVLVFCLYKKEAARLENMLRKSLSGSEVKIAGIHGDMSQPLRTASIAQFKSGIVSVLVATDVAARGLDIPDVKVVINVTFPLTVEDYVHRIGRTGRAGKEGLAITLFTEHDKALAGGLVNVLRAAGQEVPEELLRFGTTVKKKVHGLYGEFYREPGEGEARTGTKITFD